MMKKYITTIFFSYALFSTLGITGAAASTGVAPVAPAVNLPPAPEDLAIIGLLGEQDAAELEKLINEALNTEQQGESATDIDIDKIMDELNGNDNKPLYFSNWGSFALPTFNLSKLEWPRRLEQYSASQTKKISAASPVSLDQGIAVAKSMVALIKKKMGLLPPEQPAQPDPDSTANTDPNQKANLITLATIKNRIAALDEQPLTIKEVRELAINTLGLSPEQQAKIPQEGIPGIDKDLAIKVQYGFTVYTSSVTMLLTSLAVLYNGIIYYRQRQKAYVNYITDHVIDDRETIIPLLAEAITNLDYLKKNDPFFAKHFQPFDSSSRDLYRISVAKPLQEKMPSYFGVKKYPALMYYSALPLFIYLFGIKMLTEWGRRKTEGKFTSLDKTINVRRIDAWLDAMGKSIDDYFAQKKFLDPYTKPVISSLKTNFFQRNKKTEQAENNGSFFSKKNIDNAVDSLSTFCKKDGERTATLPLAPINIAIKLAAYGTSKLFDLMSYFKNFPLSFGGYELFAFTTWFSWLWTSDKWDSFLAKDLQKFHDILCAYDQDPTQENRTVLQEFIAQGIKSMNQITDYNFNTAKK